VQLRVVPFSVITIFAVAVPSYVMTSRRDTVVGVCPVYVRLACIARITVPAVGYVVPLVTTGITRPVVVSPATRVA